MRTLIRIATASLALALVTSGHTQPREGRQGRAEYRMRFSGQLDTRSGARAGVDYRTWVIPEFAKTRLDLPAGRVVVELHSGKLLTVIGDQEQRRQPGEFWTLQPGEAMTLQTEDDTVTLNTIVVR